MADHRCYSEFRGGGTGALDAEDGNNLTAGDHSVVRREDVVAEYIVKSSSASENFPFVITPDTNPGTLRHHLVTQTGLLRSYKETADTIDEEMDSIGNWSVGNGSSGTVSLLDTSSTTEVYDFSSSPGSCLMQVAASKDIKFYKNSTLADGKSLVLAFSLGMSVASTDSDLNGVALNDTPKLNFELNDNLTYNSGNGVLMQVADRLEGVTVKSFSLNSGSVSQIGQLFKLQHWPGKKGFMRIHRAGSVYHMLYSNDGGSWIHMDSYTPSASSTYVHIAYIAQATAVTPNVICRVYWMRQGTDKFDPWPYL